MSSLKRLSLPLLPLLVAFGCLLCAAVGGNSARSFLARSSARQRDIDVGKIVGGAIDGAKNNVINAYNSFQLKLNPNVPPNEYSGLNKLARRYASFASASYCHLKDIESWTCGPCSLMKNVKEVKAFPPGEDNDLRAFVAVDADKQEVLLTIRGTKTNNNWVTDFSFLWTAVDIKDAPIGIPNVVNAAGSPVGAKVAATVQDVQVHSGFQDAYKKLRPFVREELTKAVAAHPTFKVKFVGHSLGGALIVLAAMDCVKEKIVKAENSFVITYGSPRVGNDRFVQWFKDTFPSPDGPIKDMHSLRFVHRWDPVPHQPPQLVGFRHVAREVWFEGKWEPGPTIKNPANNKQWEEQAIQYRLCKLDGAKNGEDETCAEGLNPSFALDDHGRYFFSMEWCG